MASAAKTAMNKPVDWTPKVRLRSGQVANYLGQCSITGKHRVQTFKHRGFPIDPPTDPDSKNYDCTTWLLDDFGRCRGDLAASAFDYAEPA